MFVKLVEDVRKIKFSEKRTDASDFFEAVVDKTGLNELEGVLEKYFGSALKPTGKAPSKEAMKHTAPWGGIRPNQTLYYATEDDGKVHLALLWPWDDGCHVTLKLISK